MSDKIGAKCIDDEYNKNSAYRLLPTTHTLQPKSGAVLLLFSFQVRQFVR